MCLPNETVEPPRSNSMTETGLWREDLLDILVAGSQLLVLPDSWSSRRLRGDGGIDEGRFGINS